MSWAEERNSALDVYIAIGAQLRAVLQEGLARLCWGRSAGSSNARIKHHLPNREASI